MSFKRGMTLRWHEWVRSRVLIFLSLFLSVICEFPTPNQASLLTPTQSELPLDFSQIPLIHGGSHNNNMTHWAYQCIIRGIFTCMEDDDDNHDDDDDDAIYTPWLHELKNISQRKRLGMQRYDMRRAFLLEDVQQSWPLHCEGIWHGIGLSNPVCHFSLIHL